MRIALPTAIAAGLIAAFSLWFFPPRTVSAAEQLQQVVDVAQAYKGWVHVTVVAPTEMSPEMAKEIAKIPPDQIPVRMTYHSSTADGIAADVREFSKGSDVTFYSLPRHEVLTYDHTTNTIRAGTLTEAGMDSIRQHVMSPTTVGDMLATLKKGGQREPLSVTSAPEGAATRIDVSFFPSKEAMLEYTKEHSDGTPRALTIWVNADKLMTRVRFEDSTSGTYSADFTYGKPELHDIYDLGVPRTAKLVDNRLPASTGPDGALTQLINRLDERCQKGFGNYAALQTSYDVNPDGTASTESGFVKVFAVQGNKWVIASYRLLSTPRSGRGPTPGTVLTQAPEGWPNPAPEKLLPLLLPAPPSEFWVWDGVKEFQGYFNINTGTFSDVISNEAKVVPHLLADLGLASSFWPSHTELGTIGVSRVKKSLVQDAAHPKLLGIHTHEDADPKMGRDSTWDSTTWYDPARDDLPVEEQSSSTVENQPTLSSRYQTRYLEFAQLPDSKQWYPTHWQGTQDTTNRRTGQPATYVTHYRLQILPALKLEDKWFQDPRLHLASPTSQP